MCRHCCSHSLRGGAALLAEADRTPARDFLVTQYDDSTAERRQVGYRVPLVRAIVDTRWTPPVTLGVRLVSVISDDLEHVGQALYVRGILLRRAGG
jgi:hypothetical protein